jgi:PilZ domain
MKTVDGTSDASSRFAERRRMPRFKFNATMEVSDPVTKTHTSGCVTEIGQHGCFAEVETPPPVQSIVQVRIAKDNSEFKAWALVVYHRASGIGLHFLDTAQDQFELLTVWLDNLKKQSTSGEESPAEESRPRKR